MNSVVRIEVRGTPAPQGSKRHVGSGRMIEMSKAVGPWRDAVRTETQRVMQDLFAFTGAVTIDIMFYLKRPKGHYRTGKNAHLMRDTAPWRPCSTPDLDKLARAVLDGLTEGGAWKDDGQVATLLAGKYYADEHAPGCVIRISEAEE